MKVSWLPDEVTIKMLQSEVDRHEAANGFIFDGFPRTVEQAKALDNFLSDKSWTIDHVPALEVPDEELVNRLLNRVKRAVDPMIKMKRLFGRELANTTIKTAPLKNYYEESGKLRHIDGVGSIEEIFGRLKEAIG